MWLCDEVATCPECHPAFNLRQLRGSQADTLEPESRTEQLLRMDGWIAGWMDG